MYFLKSYKWTDLIHATIGICELTLNIYLYYFKTQNIIWIQSAFIKCYLFKCNITPNVMIFLLSNFLNWKRPLEWNYCRPLLSASNHYFHQLILSTNYIGKFIFQSPNCFIFHCEHGGLFCMWWGTMWCSLSREKAGRISP
jgi:hypothetical protein